MLDRGLTTNRTFHTRARVSDEQDEALRAAGDVFGRTMRAVNRAIERGNDDPRTELTDTLGVQRWYIDSAMRRVDGLRKSGVKALKRAAADYEARAEAADKKANKALERAATATTPKKRREQRASAHYAKRRAQKCRDRFEVVSTRAPRICFGGRKLFKCQHSLEQTNFATHEEWRNAWHESRSNEIFSTGDAVRRSGNRLMQLTACEDGSYNLRVSLPRPLHKQYGEHLVIEGLRFTYGDDVIAEALEKKPRPKYDRRGRPDGMLGNGSPCCQSIAVRLKRDAKSWRVMLQIGERFEQESAEERGVIGVDFNDGFLAVAEIDADGNARRRDLFRVDIPNYGGSAEQRDNAMNKAVLALVRQASSTGKPIVIEKLNFVKKKAQLRDMDHGRHARMLSALAFSQFKQKLVTRAHRNGVAVHEINPAFTSIQGAVRYATQLGTDVHHAAAVVIGRRYLRCTERCAPYAGRVLRVPSRHGHVAVTAPDRMPGRHVWFWWGRMLAAYRRAHEAHIASLKAARLARSETAAVPASLTEDAQYIQRLLAVS